MCLEKVSTCLLKYLHFLSLTCARKGVATREDIDKTFRLGMNHPMGPLQLGWLFSVPAIQHI